ncbi:Pseudouridylate synthase 7-like protein [Stylophora pistillata]|uniref:Pseudouridylate synthase 7-like protein n=2 Tax=Stylophora pistillata TaxID=50429 RepID=A0A2B4SDM6_STYPI|nr:Pseudouridylate synthase 7-like protein [Stylophora pistillata]
MSFGADCFLDCDREGFKGKVKQTYQDFIVTEIDSQGKLVELIAQDISSEIKDKNFQNINRSGKHRESIKNGIHLELKSLNKETPFLAKISESYNNLQKQAVSDLEKCLGSEKFTELRDFSLDAEKRKENNRRICICSTMLKEDRTALHRNVRLAYPHLQTVTIKSEQEGDPPSIFAVRDKVYWEFYELLNNRQQVDRLLCFAHWETRTVPSTFDLNVSSADKQQRTKIHRLLSKHFGSFLESKTFNDPEKKTSNGAQAGSYIQIRMRVKGRKSLQQNYQLTSPSQTETEYTGFVLCKRNMETLEAIHRLSSCLNIQPSAFSYAGIKDKKAITKQYMLVRGVTPEQICAIQDHPSLEGIECGSYRRGLRRSLRMGALRGNHFQVVIRNIHSNASSSLEENVGDLEKVIQDAVSSLSLRGFLNYFGPQRFGLDDKEVNACDIGLAMLQGDAIQAVKLLLTPSENNPDHPVNSAKRYYCETSDVQGTLGKMPGYKVRETLVLKGLHRHGTDVDGCRKALLNIPYSMRLLYVHSYCSLVWNQMASLRIQRYGRTAAVQGDFVVDKSVDEVEFKNSATADSYDSGSAGNSCEDDTSGVRRDCVRYVSDQDEGKHSLKDVVLPLPGYNIQYPTNDVGDEYKKRLETDGLTAKSFRLRSLGMNLPGAYRKLVAFPWDLSYKYVREAHARTVDSYAAGSDYYTVTRESSCVDSDSDAKRPRLASSGNCYEDSTKDLRPTELNEVCRRSESCCSNLEISFSLEPSCYATSCIRELMKN